MKNIDFKIKIGIIALLIIGILTIGIYIYKTAKTDEYVYYEEAETDDNQEKEENVINTIVVHITGEVNYCGVVVLNEGARIVDAIEAAGGQTNEADLNRINLAYVLSDGEKVYVPNKNDEEVEQYVTTGEGTISESAQEIININTASAEELQELPGIGEATANKIVAYRTENGKFTDIEEIKNVPGIGDSKFEGLKDMITVK